MKSFYTLPLDSKTIRKGGNHSLCELNDSISRFLDLIILTGYEEYRCDANFGCDIWDKEFDILPLETKWQMEIKRSILASIKANEIRLDDVQVEIHTDEASFLMKKIDIQVTGKIKLTGETFEHYKTIYLCPRSVG